MSNYAFVFSGTDNKRLDLFVAEEVDISRSRSAALIKEGNVTVNKKVVGKSVKLSQNDLVEVFVPKAEPYTVKPQNIPIDIVYEDDDLLVVNKPKGMVVHPGW